MAVLFFPNVNSLRLALTSNLVPLEITQAPVAARLDADGRLWLAPGELPSRESLAALARVGVQVLGGAVGATSPVTCWAELLPLHASTDPEPSHGPILFLVPDRQLAKFVARLRRRSMSPLGINLPDAGPHGFAWVTVANPPADILAEAIETHSPVEVFVQQAADVWVRHGWRHAVPDQLVVPDGAVLLVRPPRSILAVACIVPLSEPDDFALPVAQCPKHATHPAAPPIGVKLTLASRESTGPETLWVLDAVGEATFWAFCAVAAATVTRRLEAAEVGRESDTRLVVRATGKRPEFLSLGAGFAPDPRVPGLWLPVGKSLRPVLRIRELTRALGVRPGHLVWVEPATSDSGLVMHSVPEAAFRPVADRIEYTSPTGFSLKVEPRTDPFAFARFVVQPDLDATVATEIEILEPFAEELPPAGQETEEPGWFRRAFGKLLARLLSTGTAEPRTTVEEPQAEPAPRGERGERVERTLASPDAVVHGHDWAARRRELEARLFRDLPELGPAGRSGRWADLAAIYTATGNHPDAAICWLNAAWESPFPPPVWLEQWLAAECRTAKLTDVGGLERWLSEPSRPGVGRVIAAYTAWAGFTPTTPPEFVAALPRLLALLDQHFDDLPVRAAWLGRLAAARVCEGDALGLARWRDRIIARLSSRGPGLDLDEPSFLRFHGTATADRFQTAREWLIKGREPALAWVQKQGNGGGLRYVGLDAETESTAAYAQFLFAWGLGCLGERTRAKDWAARARKAVSRAGGLGVDSAAHAFLGDLFLLRVKDAQEGRSAKFGLPPELQTRLEQLPEFARYAVDRLRSHSRILETADRVRPYRGHELKVFWGADILGERLFVLTERTSSAHIAEEADALLKLCSDSPTTDTVPRVVLTLLEVAPRLSPVTLLRVLDLLPGAIDWTEAWLATGPWLDKERARKSVEFPARMLEAAFNAAGALPAEVSAPGVSRLIRRLLNGGDVVRAPLYAACGPIFRAVRRLGLRGEAEAVARFLDISGSGHAGGSSIKGEQPGTITAARLGLAIGWFVAGDEDAGNRILNEARDALFLGTISTTALARTDSTATLARTELAVAYAEALGFAPWRIAHGRLEEIFQRLDRIYVEGTTNRYFTLKPLQLIDAVVRSVVTDEFTLGPTVRSWLDDDEFLIRGRIHRDLAIVLRDQGITFGADHG